MARIKGQETELLISVDAAPRTNITNIRDLEITAQLEILSEGYLGQTTEQKDMIFNGIEGKFSCHFDNQDVLKLAGELIDKARRRTPGVKINLKTTLNFANGQRPRILIPDCEFGPLPLGFGSRKEFLTASFTFASSGYQFLF